MNNFSQFNISAPSLNFKGDKIKISKVLNKQITVHDYKIEPSQFDKGDKKRLVLQIEVDGDLRIIFSGSAYLKQMIEQVPKDKFPFKTIIIEDNESLQFT